MHTRGGLSLRMLVLLSQPPRIQSEPSFSWRNTITVEKYVKNIRTLQFCFFCCAVHERGSSVLVCVVQQQMKE